MDPERLMRWCRALAVVVAIPRLNRGPRDAGTEFLLRLAAL
ncbi:hypothetical protein [Streptosporangium minutum]|nr:hypothetical protein [Streptosporangium minutum]